MRNVSKIFVVALAMASALSVAGCVNSEQASSQPPGESESFPPPSSEEESAPPETSAPESSGVSTAVECTAKDIKVAGKVGAKPTITLPDNCSPPTALLKKDLAPGNGPEVTAGSNVQVNYLLMTWSDGQEVDTSWAADREPYPMENVGQAEVVQGWNEGMIGIKQGGRRLLVVPPDLGYGEQGKPPVKPNETLVFVVEAVAVTSA